MMSHVAIIAPSPIAGSGGVARIYNYAKALNSTGHRCDVYAFDGGGRSSNDLCRDAQSFYAVDAIHIASGLNLSREYDLLIATRWDTAKIVRDLPSRKKAYLVQDYEACFNPVGDGTILAENSYLYGLQTITYGRWLALKLYSEFGNAPYYCSFASDLKTFRVKQKMSDRIGKPPAICFIYQHDKPRRCPLLGIETLSIVKHIRPDVKIYFVGSNDSPKLSYEYTSVGLLNKEGLNDLYNRCHVGFCLSSSNPSCNPFDMMAAGLPSVDLYRENNLFDIPGEGVLLAHQTPESLAEAILYLISNPDIILRMSEFGVNFMKQRSAIKETDEFLSAVESILSGNSSNFDVNEIMKHSFSGKAVIASACMNSAILRHVQGQTNKFINNESAINDITEGVYKSHNLVATLSHASRSYPVNIRKSLKMKIRRFLKNVSGVA